MPEILGIVETFVLLARDSEAYNTGRTCGAVFWPLIMLAGIIKCLSIARREETSGLCVYALAVLLLAWGYAAIARTFPDFVDGAEMVRIVKIGNAGVLLMMTVVSVVLAIVGLAQYRGYTQGRAQAIWALVLSSILLALFGYGVVKGLEEARTDAAPMAAVQPAAGEALRFEQFNFRCRMPESGWTQINAEAINPDATLILRRARPEVWWQVIAEEFGPDLLIDNQTLAQIAMSNAQSESGTVEFSEPRPTTVAGLDALTMTADAITEGMLFTYDFRILVHNGYAYQLIAWGEQRNRQQVGREAERLAGSFELIDATRVSTGEAWGETIDRLSLPRAGVSASLPGDGWITWDELDVDFPQASTGAMYSFQAPLAVVALPMDEIEASDREVADALLGTLDMSIGGPEVLKRESVGVGPARGFRFEVERESEIGPLVYRLYTLRTDHWAYLISGWSVPERMDLVAHLDQTIRGFEIRGDTPARTLPAQAEAHADLYNTLGLSAWNAGDYGRARAGFLKARERHPEYATYSNNVLLAHEQLEQYDAGAQWGLKHLRRFPDHHEVRATVAYLQTYGEAQVPAIENYRRAFAAGHESDHHLLDYVRTLRGQEMSAEALDALEDYAQNPDDTFLAIERFRAWSDLEQHDKALAQLETLCADPLADAWILAEWVHALGRAGETRAAVERGEALTEKHGDLAEVWYARGLAEMALEWYPLARASFQRATELSSDSRYRDELDYVALLLGRGDNSLIRRPVTPVAFPAALETYDAPTHPAADEYHAHVQRDIRAYFFEPGELRRSTVHKRVKITGPDALEDWSTVDTDFDSQYERVYVNELVVRDAAGRVVGRGDVDTYFVVDDQQDGINSDDKTLQAPVPGLAVGHTLDFTITYETLGTAEKFPFKRRRFLTWYPTNRMVIFVDGVTDQIAVEAAPGIREVEVERGRAWAVEPVEVYRWEPLLPNLDTLFPVLCLGPTGQAWEDLATEYLEDLEDTIRAPADFPKQAEQILRNADTPRQVITRATEHVQRHLTYEAIEFGVRGVIPHTLEQITAQRFGDCKDHALYLYHLLRAGGVEAHLALVDSSHPLVPGLPSMSQFDHMVVYVPDTDGGLVLDATDKSHAALNGTPAGVNGQTLLVLDPARPRLVDDTPPVVDNVYEARRTVRVTEAGDAVVHEVLTAGGPWGEGLLEFLRGKTPEKQLADAQNSLDVEEGLRLTKLTTSDLTDLNEPLRLTLEYTVAGAFERRGDGWLGRLPAAWEVYYLAPTFLPERRQDFERDNGFVFRSTVEFEPPPGYALPALPPLTRYDEPTLDARIQTQRTGTGLTLTSEITLRPGRFDADLYTTYYDTLDRTLRALRPALRLEPSPGGTR